MDIIKCKHKEYLRILDEYNKHHIIKRILCDEHQLLTFSYLKSIKEKEVYNPTGSNTSITLTKKNNIIRMNEHLLLRAIDIKSDDYFFYIQNISYFTCKKSVIIISNDHDYERENHKALETILQGICECTINKDKKAECVYVLTTDYKGTKTGKGTKTDKGIKCIITDKVYEGGDLFIAVSNNTDLNALTDIAHYFEKVELLVNNIIINRVGMLKFTNYKPTTGVDKLGVEERRQEERGQEERRQEERRQEERGVNKFGDIGEAGYNNKIKQIKFEIKKLEEFKTYYLTRYIQYQIDIAKDICKRYNIKFNKLCRINLDNYKLAKKFFNYDKISPNILKKIRFNGDSIYSVSSVTLSEQISKIIKEEFPNVKTIIDGSANIGGNTINFAKHFDNVISNEYDSDTFSLLQNNVNAFNFKNVVCYNQSILTLDIPKTNNTCIFLDPPWGGIYIKYMDVVDLYYGTTNVVDFINTTILKHKHSYWCMKVPPNFNFGKMYSIQTNRLHIYRGDGCYILTFF
jgi:16S rRNA G966 N2-methylase RsmD